MSRPSRLGGGRSPFTADDRGGASALPAEPRGGDRAQGPARQTLVEREWREKEKVKRRSSAATSPGVGSRRSAGKDISSPAKQDSGVLGRGSSKREAIGGRSGGGPRARPPPGAERGRRRNGARLGEKAGDFGGSEGKGATLGLGRWRRPREEIVSGNLLHNKAILNK